MKIFLFYLPIFLLTIFSYFRIASSQLTCSDPLYYTTSTPFACTNTNNYISGSSITNFPTSTKALTVSALFSLDSITDPGCAGSTYPVSLFTLTLNYGGPDITILELVRLSNQEFKYSLMGVQYNGQDVGTGTNVFPVGTWIEVKASVDLANNKANMATSYLNDLNFDAALPGSVSFTNSAWAFDGNTKFWFGGGPSATKRYKLTLSKLTVWNGHLPVLTIGATPYPGEILLGHSPVLVANYKLQGIGNYALTDESTAGTAYLGASTAGTSNLANAPTWVSNSPILEYTATNQYIKLPNFPVAAPNALVKASLSVSFWIQPASQSGTNYIFRYSTSGPGNDRFALKLVSGTQLQACAWSTCQTAFSVSALSATSWTLITVNWAYRATTSTNLNCYYSVYANGVLIKPQWISGFSGSAISYASATDVVRFGGFLGKLAAIQIYSPGSLQVNSGTWCNFPTCGADIGATNPPTCLKPTTCHSSCSQCTDETDSGCLVCASGKFFSSGKCISCPVGFFLSGVLCASCSAGCDVCSSTSTCTTCSAGFFLSGGSCTACTPNCDVCATISTCGTCTSGFYLSAGTCGSTCPVTTYISGSVCAACPGNCDVCSGPSTCTTCSSGYRKYNNLCYNPCPVGTYADSGITCAGCSSSNCNSCSSPGVCTGCASGYYLYNSVCYNPCPVTTYISGSICAACPNHCDTCSSSGTICTGCSSGYYLYTGQCYSTCPLTTYISGSVCAACPGNCDVCSGSSTCTTCSPGYRKYSNLCYNPCPVGTYADSGTTCAACPSHCDTCSSSSVCTGCTSGYYLYNSACHNPCPATTYISGSICAACPNHCDTCSSGGTICTGCSSGYYLYAGQCASTCPLTTYISGSVCAACPANCNTCSSGSLCTVCSSSYKLYNSLCHNPCPVTTFPFGTICKNCPSHCDVCSDENTCVSCTGAYLFYQSVCYLTCPVKTFPSGANCLNCPNNCDTCSDANTCTACSPGFRLYLGQCYDPCPATTYPATTTTCSNCENDCHTCSDATTCSLCSTTYYLYQQDCYGGCPLTTFPVGTNCQDCSTNCEICIDQNTCTACSLSSFLYKKKCYGSCPITTYTSGTNCLDCSNYCDACIDSNTCTACTYGYYFYLQKCYQKCPPKAPYISPTVAPYICYKSCPSPTPYSYEYECYVKCPKEAPYESGYVCSSENPDTVKETANIASVGGSTAKTVMVTRRLASYSNPGPFMFGSLMKLLQYIRYINVSHSERLEIVFQTITDSADYIPSPSMSDEMQGAFEDHPLPDVFEKYDLSSNFMLNEGDDILNLLTILSLFALTWIMQKIIFYLRNVPRMRSFVVKARFFFQNYLLSGFYELLGDVAFASVLELKTLKVHDRYSRLSFTACLVCLVLGAILYILNIWIVYAYQKRREIYKEEVSKKKELEDFSEKYSGIEILFNDFEDRSFVHQAALLFFVGRNIIFCLVIALLYSRPLLQSMLLLILDLCLVIYYLWKRSIKSRLDYVEQLTYELILLAVNVCILILAIADSMKSNTYDFVKSLGEIIIVLNIICRFLPFVFLGINFVRTVWEYYKLLKLALKSKEVQKKQKREVSSLRRPREASHFLGTTIQNPRKLHQTSSNNSFQELNNSSNITSIETMENMDQSGSPPQNQNSRIQVTLMRPPRAPRRPLVPFNPVNANRRLLGPRPLRSENSPSPNRVPAGVFGVPHMGQIVQQRRMNKIKKGKRRNDL